MSIQAATVLFALVLLGLLALPFLPALRELRRPTDATALTVAADGRVAVTFFAQRFGQFVQRQLSGPLEEARAGDSVLHGHLQNHDPFVAFPDGSVLGPDFGREPVEVLLLCAGGLLLTREVRLRRECYVEGDAVLAAGSSVRALLAGGDVTLGEGGHVARWLHGGGRVRLGATSTAPGRVSSAVGVEIGRACGFRRLGAPVLHFGEGSPNGDDAVVPVRRVSPADFPGHVCDRGGRHLFDRDLELPAEAEIDGDLVVRGDLVLGRRSRIRGSVKARRVLVEREGRIDGSAVAVESIRTGADVRVHGPMLCEGEIELGERNRVGAVDALATVRAERLGIGNGSVVHGSVWAMQEGVVR